MLTPFRILFDVAVFRLRRLEMANLGGAVSVMLALGLALPELAYRTAFALLLNLLAYLTNDYCDIDRDLATGRADAKTRFLAAHRRAALHAQIGLAAVLAVAALVTRPGLLVALVLGEGLCLWYSAHLKRVAFADLVAMAVCGGAMALVAVPLDRLLGLVLVIELGLFSGAFELIQVLRDRSEDAAAGTRTTAVVLGERGTLWLLRGTILLAAGFATLALHRFLGPLLLLAALLPYRAGEARSHWNRLRLVFGLVWLGIVVTTVLDTRTHGLWLQIAQSAAV